MQVSVFNSKLVVMTRLSKLFLFVGIAIIPSGCLDTPADKDYKPTSSPHYLAINNDVFNFSAEGDSRRLYITSSENWYFSDYATWLSFSSDSGLGDAILTLTAEENLSADIVRTSIFYINTIDDGWKYSKMLSADQKAAKPYINFSPESLTISGSSTSNNVKVNANTKWEASCDADWLEVVPATDLKSFDVIVSENLTNGLRTADVIVKGATTKTFTVTQNSANFTSDTKYLEYSQSGGSYLLSINSEVSWSATTPYDWIDITPVKGVAGETTVTISTSPNWESNSRMGSIGFYIGKNKYASIGVKQDGVKLSAEVEELEIRALGGSKTVNIESNISWKILSKPNWISATPEYAQGNTVLSISVDNNSGSTNRSGIIKIGNDSFTQTAEIYVSQQGKYFSVNNEALSIGSTGGKMQVALSTNDSWSVRLMNNEQWISITQKTGEESNIIDLNVGDNPSVNPRSEIARITPMDLDPVSVIIRQNARFLTVDSDGVQFFSKGGTSSPIIISTDGKFSVSEQSDWFTITQDGNILRVIADANDTGHERTGNIIITLTDLTEGSMSLTLTVKQIAPGGTFGKEFFTEDNLWDAAFNGIFSISVIGYAKDEQWDEKLQHGLTMTIEGYKGDTNWDISSGLGAIGKDNYADDDSYNAHNGSGSSHKDNYPDDDSYNAKNGKGNLGKDNYPKDENYDNNVK